MNSLLRHKVTPVWLLLILATAVSWEFGHGFGFGSHYGYATIAIVLIAFIKVRFVFLISWSCVPHRCLCGSLLRHGRLS